METDEQPAADAPGRAAGSADPGAGATLGALASLFVAAGKVVAALRLLLAAEVQVFRASAGLVVMGGIALVALAVSLWVCLVALIGWGVAVASGSVGIALAALVVLHLILLVITWFWVRSVIWNASFPATRAELHALGKELRRDAARFQRAGAADDQREDEA